MGQALYRKYRSKTLDEVVGQEHITSTLANALKNGRFSHAYLFTGPRGVGKTSIARILAHEINQLPYDDKAGHLDIIEIDAASNRRIDDIRDLREKVHIAPVNAKYKVYIIDEVHMLTGESFNALLKTLEEPPAHVIFILATTEVQKLPATIISRTQRYHFRPISHDKVAAHLGEIAKKEKIDIDKDALELIADHGEGSIRDSISLLDQLASMNGKKITLKMAEEVLGVAPKQLIDGIIEKIGAGDRAGLQADIEDAYTSGTSPIQLVRQLMPALQQKAATEPRLYDLIDALIDVPKSTMPEVKLLTSLLKAALPAGSVVKEEPKPVKRAATMAFESETVAEVSLKKEAPKPKTAEPKRNPDDEIVAAKPIKNGGKALTEADWPAVLTKLHTTSPSLFSVLKNANIKLEGDELTLTFGFKLHQKKVDDQRYRTQLSQTIIGLGFDCPQLSPVYDPKASNPIPFVPVKSDEKPANDKTATDVLAMMGGGEVISG